MSADNMHVCNPQVLLERRTICRVSSVRAAACDKVENINLVTSSWIQKHCANASK